MAESENYDELFKQIQSEEAESISRANDKVGWNFDVAEGFLIFGLKDEALIYLNHDHPKEKEAYSKIRQLWLETDAALNDKERQEAESIMTELEQIRQQHEMNEYNMNFFHALEKTYLWLCRKLQLHGVYFSKGKRINQGGL